MALAAIGLGFAGFVSGCSKKEAAVVEDAGWAPASTMSAPQITEIAPLEDEAGVVDAAPTAPRKYGGGGGQNANQARIKQCCNAMRTQVKAMGAASPEGFQLNALATQCDIFAAQVGPQGNAPELGQLREILKSVKLPAACQM